MFSVNFLNFLIFLQIVSYLNNQTEAHSLAKTNNEMMVSSSDEIAVDSTGDFVDTSENDMNEQFDDETSNTRTVKEHRSNEILKRSENAKNLLSLYCRMKMSRW